MPGLDGCPQVVYYAEVGEDSDGPVQLVRPMAQMSDPHALATGGAAFEALRAHATANRLVMAQPPRQVMIAGFPDGRGRERGAGSSDATPARGPSLPAPDHRPAG